MNEPGMGQQGMGEQDSVVPATWGAPDQATQSIAEPVLSGEYGAVAPPEAPEVLPVSSKLPWFAAVFGAMVLLVGGGFFALTAFGASGGADTPEEAVDALIAAANDEDFISMAELLEPSERRTIAEPLITELLPELVRLGVLDDSVDAGNVEGFDVEFTEVTYRVDPIAGHADMVSVTFTGGQASGEFVSAEFPFGDEFRDRFGDEITDEPRTTEDIEPSDNSLVLVERDGRWYMSAMFSMAEAARLEAGEQMPILADMPPALGSSTPEDAVEAMFAEMVELDMAGFIGRMDPEEMAVLYRYSPMFLEEGQAGLDDFRGFLEDNNVQWDLSDFDFDVETDGDDASVEIRGFRLEVTSSDFDVNFTYGRDRITGSLVAGDFGEGSLDATPTRWSIEGTIDGERIDVEVNLDNEAKSVEASGEVAGETFSASMNFDDDGECSRYSVTASDGTDESGCVEDELQGDAPLFTNQYLAFLENFDDEFGGAAVAARRTDGEWYVSPVTTMLDYYIASLQNLDEGQFERMLDDMAAVPLYGLGGAGVLNEYGTEPAFDVFDVEDAVPDESFFDEPMMDDEFFDNDDVFDNDEFFGPEVTLGSSSAAAVDPGASLTLTDQLESSTFDQVNIDLQAGDIVTVTAQADPDSGLDTTLEVFFADQSIAYNDDADSSAGIGLFDSSVEVKAQMTGTYTIELRSFGDFGEGEYTLTIERS